MWANAGVNMRGREERRKETEFQGTPKRLKLEGFHKTANCRGKVPAALGLSAGVLTTYLGS